MGHFDWPRCFLIGALQAWIFIDGVVADRDMNLVHNYVTRPELQAPKWNVTIYDQANLSPGYIFVAPYERIGQTESGDGWIAPHIYDQNGDLIWSGAHQFENMSVMDFRISKVQGQDEMTLIRPELRSGVIMNDNFEVTKKFPIEGFNMHDWNFIDNGTRALSITRGMMNSSREDAVAAHLEEGLCSANFLGIVEYDVETWEKTWEWSSKDRIWLNESTMAYGPAKYRCSPKGYWDYLHANAVDECPDGDLILSGRHTDAIYKISRATGDIVWRLGGKANDFEMVDGFQFSRQHDVRCRAQNETTTIITFLDNAKGEDPQKVTHPNSRGVRVAVNNETMQATLVQSFEHPSGPGSFAFRRGTYQQIADDDHVVMGWSEQSHLSEHLPDGTLLMEMIMLPQWVGTYRSYKFPFIGRPTEPPVVAAWAIEAAENTTHTVAWVSWNGATEVASWRLSKSTEDGSKTQVVSTTPRSGFETTLVYEGYAAYIFVDALDANGEMVGSTGLSATVPPQDMQSTAVLEEQAWLQEVVARPPPPPPVEEQQKEIEKPVSTINLDPKKAAAFATGFIIAVLFVAISLTIWYFVRRKNGKGFFPAKLPWHQQHVYQPIGSESKASSRAVSSSTFHDEC